MLFNAQISSFGWDIIPPLIPIPDSKTFSSKISYANAWKVLIFSSDTSNSVSNRSSISNVAFSLNVKHRISDGLTPFFIICFTRSVITRVFPVPGPATTSRGEVNGDVTASTCSSFRVSFSFCFILTSCVMQEEPVSVSNGMIRWKMDFRHGIRKDFEHFSR